MWNFETVIFIVDCIKKNGSLLVSIPEQKLVELYNL